MKEENETRRKREKKKNPALNVLLSDDIERPQKTGRILLASVSAPIAFISRASEEEKESK